MALAKAKNITDEREVCAIYENLTPIRSWQDAVTYAKAEVWWRHEPKRNGGFRKVCSLPDDLAMWNYLVRDLIFQTFNPRQHIGHWPRRGRDAQIKAMRASCIGPHVYAVAVDVRNAFECVSPDALYNLPHLPEALVRGALDARSNEYRYIGGRLDAAGNTMPDASCNKDAETGPHGLLQGSPTSDLVFGMLVNDLSDHIPENLGCFSYSDNVIVLTSNEREALLVSDALVEYFARHPAGPFSLRTEVASLSGGGFDHLGYWFRWNWDHLRVGLSIRNEARFNLSLDEPGRFNVSGFRYVQRSFGSCTVDALDSYAHYAADNTLYRLSILSGAAAS